MLIKKTSWLSSKGTPGIRFDSSSGLTRAHLALAGSMTRKNAGSQEMILCRGEARPSRKAQRAQETIRLCTFRSRGTLGYLGPPTCVRTKRNYRARQRAQILCVPRTQGLGKRQRACSFVTKASIPETDGDHAQVARRAQYRLFLLQQSAPRVGRDTTLMKTAVHALNVQQARQRSKRSRSKKTADRAKSFCSSLLRTWILFPSVRLRTKY